MFSRLIATATAALLALAVVYMPALSQFQPGFNPSLTASSVSSNVALGKASEKGATLLIINQGPADVRVMIGPNSSATATTTDMFVPASTARTMTVPSVTTPYFAAISTSASSATLQLSQGKLN